MITLNRTVVELKFGNDNRYVRNLITLNRTIEELKPLFHNRSK